MGRASRLLLALLLLAGCASPPSSEAVRTAPSVVPGKTGYVRMVPLLRAHPLHGALTRLDESIATLRDANAASPEVGTEIAAEERALRRELESAQQRAREVLREEKGREAAREDAAIAQILHEPAVTAPGASAVRGDIAAVSQAQARSVAAQAERNFEAYRAQMLAQSQNAFANVRAALIARADQEYRAEVEAAEQREGRFALEQAQRDAIQRLLLRTRLKDLALDKQAGAATQAQLDALNRKEADELSVVRARDRAELEASRKRLSDRLDADIRKTAEEMRGRTIAKLDARGKQTQAGIVGQITTVPQPTSSSAPPPDALPPEVRAKLLALHERYRADFAAQTERTIQAFARTGDDLTAHFEELRTADAAARAGTHAEIEGLRKRRDDLYREMTAQIEREAHVVAKRHGIGAVLSDPHSPGDAVNLTSETLHEIESMHQ